MLLLAREQLELDIGMECPLVQLPLSKLGKLEAPNRAVKLDRCIWLRGCPGFVREGLIAVRLRERSLAKMGLGASVLCYTFRVPVQVLMRVTWLVLWLENLRHPTALVLTGKKL